MKYGLMERLFWKVFSGDYKRGLEDILHISNGGEVMKKAHKKYKEMLLGTQDPHNRFFSNLILASIFGSIYLSLEEKPPVEQLIIFNWEAVMNNKIMLKKVVGERNYTRKGQQALAENAKQSVRDNNPYSWRYTYEAGKSVMEYTVKFMTCGILHLYKQWGISEITPAMCKRHHIDFIPFLAQPAYLKYFSPPVSIRTNNTPA